MTCDVSARTTNINHIFVTTESSSDKSYIETNLFMDAVGSVRQTPTFIDILPHTAVNKLATMQTQKMLLFTHSLNFYIVFFYKTMFSISFHR